MEQYMEFNIDGKTVRGILHLSDQGGHRLPAVVFCHGFTGNKIGLHRIFVKAARYFCQKGFAVLRFDFSGCGESDGDHKDITVNQQVKEARAAISFLRKNPRIDQNQIYLVGLSLGGAVAALAAVDVPALAGLVLWAPVTNLYSDIRGIVGEKIFSEAFSAGSSDYQGFILGRPFLESLRENSPLAAAGEFAGPLLVLHGTGDMEIPHTNAGLYIDARSGLSFPTEAHLIQGADHSFSAHIWENEAFSVTWQWIRRH